jgi:hypothetical protein
MAEDLQEERDGAQSEVSGTVQFGSSLTLCGCTGTFENITYISDMQSEWHAVGMACSWNEVVV